VNNSLIFETITSIENNNTNHNPNPNPNTITTNNDCVTEKSEVTHNKKYEISKVGRKEISVKMKVIDNSYDTMLFFVSQDPTNK